MPRRKEAWAAWNVLREGESDQPDICVSYSMNLLQAIDPAMPLFVTLNPPRPPRADLTFATFSYAHPQYDQRAFDAQVELRGFNGLDRISFAGAWTGYGFHEDGLTSGMAVARHLGATMPWDSSAPALAAAE
jgi:hypothetical protein